MKVLLVSSESASPSKVAGKDDAEDGKNDVDEGVHGPNLFGLVGQKYQYNSTSDGGFNRQEISLPRH